MSVHNERVKQWSQLLDKKGRTKQRKFLVEGIHLVNEALRSNYVVECVVYAMERGVPAELERGLSTREHLSWVAVSEAVLAKCTSTETPQSVFAVVLQPNEDWQHVLDDPSALVVVIDNVQDPGNLGTVIRCCDAVAATAVILGRGTVDLYNPKTVRATMGSLFHLPIVEAELPPLLHTVKEQGGVAIVGTSLQAKRTCFELDFTGPTWLVLGNEGAGLSPDVEAFVTEHTIIPMLGQAESLNVAMAATVLLYEAVRQRRFN